MSGIVTSIQRFSLDDGPGIRTTVFLKGCPLRCQWCHNPESLGFAVQLGYKDRACTRCGDCAAVCPETAHRIGPDRHDIARARCTACGRCVKACPQAALRLIGESMDAASVVGQLLPDRDYYGVDGGVTVSGGEPLAQPAFLEALLCACKRHGLHTCIETSGYTPPATLRRIAPQVDLFLFDIKHTDEAAHRRYTGVPLQPILENLRLLQRIGAHIWLRCPIIPGVNDNLDHFAALSALAQHPSIQRAEVLPYHNLGDAKWSEVGLCPPMPHRASATESDRQRWQALI